MFVFDCNQLQLGLLTGKGNNHKYMFVILCCVCVVVVLPCWQVLSATHAYAKKTSRLFKLLVAL